MNKRIRKKHLKRTVRELVAAYNEYEARREHIYRKAHQNLMDAMGKSHEEFIAALRQFIEITSLMARTGPPPRSLRE